MSIPDHLRAFSEMIEREWQGNRATPTPEEERKFFELLAFIIKSSPTLR